MGRARRAREGTGILERVARGPFARLAAANSVALAVVMYFPFLLGRVPLPADLLGYFPVWEDVRVAPMVGHGELGDLLTLMYPWRIVLAESFRRGELPFWNPHSFVGSPFLANPISAVFYPPHWLYAVLPVWLAWSVQFPLRLMLATFFAAVLARRLGASRSGSLVAGWIFGLSGFPTGWQGWPQADVVVWTPLCLLGVLELRRSPGPRAAALLALALALSILAGHPEVSLYSLCAVVAFALWNLLAAWRRRRRLPWAARYVACLILAGVLAAGICAVQLVPTAEWLPRITRSLDRLWGPRASRDWLAIVSRDTQTSSSSAGLLFPEEGAYAGVATLLLSPLAFFLRRKQASAFFGLLGFVALSVTFGWFPFSPLFRAIPVFRAMPGNRILGILDLSLATLAGLGWTALGRLRRQPAAARAGMVCLCAAATATAVAAWVLRDRMRELRIADPLRRPDAVLVLVAVSLVPIMGALMSRRELSAWRAAAATVLFLDLGSFAWRHVPFVPRGMVFPPGPVTDFLRSHTKPGDRIVFLDGTAFRNVEIAYGLETIDGYPQVLRQTASLLAPLNGGTSRDEPLRQIRGANVMAAGRSRYLLDLLGVRFLVTSTYGEEAVQLARLGELFPLRYSAGSVRIFENLTARERVFSPDARCRVGDLVLRAASVSGIVSCETPGCLVSAQTFYPGWRARLAGRPVDVRPTAEGLCSIDVPAGQNRFRFEFRPTAFSAALAISGTSVLMEIGILWMTRGRRAARPRSRRNASREGTVR